VVIRNARLRWAGHVARMDENCMPRRLMGVCANGRTKKSEKTAYQVER
jgi:hypothetical protein